MSEPESLNPDAPRPSKRLGDATKHAVPGESTIVVGANRVRFLRDGREAYPAMLAAIATAQREILIEMYWFGGDAIGHQFADALSARAKDGVTVRVIYDAIGSSPIDYAMFDALREAGADVRTFNPLLRLWRRMIPHWVRRDHRKILVCDSSIGFTGGLNIGRPWAPIEAGGDGWRDDMVESIGPAARELRIVFYETWRRLLLRKERHDVRKLPTDIALLSPTPPNDVWVIGNRRKPTRRAIRTTYLRWIHNATHAIDLVNAYFVPEGPIRRALVAAVRRGVRVRVLVPRNGDLTVVQWAVEATLERLVKLGVEAYAYTGAVLHSKTAVVDRDLVTIGSYDLDYRSLRYNQEVNVAVRSETFADIVRGNIERDHATSDKWTYEVLRARGFARRMLGRFALLFTRFL